MSKIRNLILIVALSMIIVGVAINLNIKAFKSELLQQDGTTGKCIIEITSKQPVHTLPYNVEYDITDPVAINIKSPKSNPIVHITPITQGVMLKGELSSTTEEAKNVTIIMPGNNNNIYTYLLIPNNENNHTIQLNITITKNDETICTQQVNITVS